MPAYQRLEANHLAVDSGERLIVQTEIVPLDGDSEFLLDRTPLAQLVVHFDFEETRLATASGLGAIERRIGIVEERCGVMSIGWKDRDPDADSNTKTLTAQFTVDCDRRMQAFGDAFSQRRVIADRRDDAEFVAAKARQIGIANQRT